MLACSAESREHGVLAPSASGSALVPDRPRFTLTLIFRELDRHDRHLRALPASFVTDERFHRMLLWAILPASMLAFGLGCWRHKDHGVLLLGVLGLLGLSSSVAAPHDLIGEIGERFLTVGSAGLLIAGHLRNFKRCRADDCDHEQASG